MAADPEPVHISSPTQLRLSALLAALVATAEERRAARAAATPAVPPAAATISPGDAVVIDSADGLTIAEILDATASAGFGFVIALLALTAIPFVGMSTPFGVAIVFVGAQLLIGRTRPWLPARIRRVALSAAALTRIARWLRRATGWMSHLVRERGGALTAGPALAMVGLGLVILGAGLALPLPIPGSNLVFIVPVLIYGIGLLEKDGLLMVIGHVMALAHVVLAIAAWQVVSAALAPLARWIGIS
ncbi:MAG: exopolysaccharide biosynthesis protein [Myxococcales bacterium]|nr:exopolysaccharide biosynthesis protein [Myxococcales bacterium]